MISEITYNLQAFISLLPTDKGGRKKSIFSGYKPSLIFNTNKHYCAEVELLNIEEVKPGSNAFVKIKLLAARTIRKNLQINDSFTITEGNKAIGSGMIINKVVKEESSIPELVH
jgi:translation elongation factor EF-Tu-like GTPase